MGMLPIILMFVVLWFIMIRPQMKKAKEHQKMVGELAKGDEIVTQGGMTGRIAKVGENYLSVEVAEGKTAKTQIGTADIEKPVDEFSGGWQRRLAAGLAATLTWGAVMPLQAQGAGPEQIQQLRLQLRQSFPQYEQMVRPRPPTTAQIAERLDELMNAPASTKVEIRPSLAACDMIAWEVGTTCNWKPGLILRPLSTCAATRRSSSRPLAQLPR